MSTSKFRSNALRRIRCFRIGDLAALLFCCAARIADATAAEPPVATAAAPPAPADIAVSVNGLTQPESSLALLDDDGRGEVWLPQTELRRLRLRVPADARVQVVESLSYVSLRSLPLLAYEFDAATQTLALKAPPIAFDEFHAGLALPTQITPVRGDGGAFLSYDAYAQRAGGLDSGGVLAEAGLVTAWGVLTSSHALRLGAGAGPRLARSATTFTIDQPAAFRSIRLGDFISPGPAWASPRYAAGIQAATNFSLRPGFVYYPLQSVRGQSALPSVADIYLGNVFAGRQDLEAGPFVLDNLPIANGAGEMNVVVRDALGREQTITVPFYGSSQLLRAGLNEYSVSLGMPRRPGIAAGREYEGFLGSAIWRRGITDGFTLGTGVESVGRNRTAGASVVALLGDLGEFDLAGAVGRRAPSGTEGARRGSFLEAGWTYRATSWSVGARQRSYSRDFPRGEEIVQTPPAPYEQTETQILASYSGGTWGAVSASYLRQRRSDDGDASSDLRVGTISYSRSIGPAGFVSLLLSDARGAATQRAVYVSYTLPLDTRHTASASLRRIDRPADGSPQAADSDTSLSLQRSLPAGEGLGYRLEATDRRDARAELRLATRIGEYGVDWARRAGSSGIRVGASGSLVRLGGQTYASRRLGAAYGVVRVPDYAGVRVYADNQLIGRTDAQGNVFVPDLRPFQNNKLSINPDDIPIDAEVLALKIDAAPYFRNGLVITFPVRHANGATIRLVDGDGAPLPPGAVVSLLGSAEPSAPVALNGEAFLSGLGARNELEVTLNDKRCRILVSYQPSGEAIPQLGTFRCELK